MPALVNNSVGSLAGTSDDECTRRCLLFSKKRRKVSRVSEPERRRIGSIQFSKAGSPPRHRGTEKGKIEHEGHGENEGLNCQSCLTSWRVHTRSVANRACARHILGVLRGGAS